MIRKWPLLVSLFVSTQGFAGAGFKYSSNQKWETRALLFQNHVQPVVHREQIAGIEAQTFSHPAGMRQSADLVLTIPSIPVGAFARMGWTPKSAIGMRKMAFESGVFWYGKTRALTGQLGVSYMHEGPDQYPTSQFIVPQFTLRSFSLQSHISSIQHISYAVTLKGAYPDRIHTFHELAYVSPITSKSYWTLGGNADLYLIMKGDPTILSFSDSNGTTEREAIQILLGPTGSVIHETFGALRLSVSQVIAFSQNRNNERNWFVRFFKLPALSAQYNVTF